MRNNQLFDELRETQMQDNLRKTRDYLYNKREDLISENSPYHTDDIAELAVVINLLNREITCSIEDIKRKRELDKINEIPEGYNVFLEEGNRILVYMSSCHIGRTCANTLVYRGRKYKYGEIEPGLGIRRWYYLVNE